MKIIDVITSRLLLMFPEILNFQKIYNPTHNPNCSLWKPQSSNCIHSSYKTKWCVTNVCRFNWQVASLVYNATSTSNKHHMGWEAHLAWKCLFMPIFSAGDFNLWSRSNWPGFWLVSRFHCQICARKTTSLCVQRLWFVPPWLTSKHTHIHTHTDSISTSLYEKFNQLC